MIPRYVGRGSPEGQRGDAGRENPEANNHRLLYRDTHGRGEQVAPSPVLSGAEPRAPRLLPPRVTRPIMAHRCRSFDLFSNWPMIRNDPSWIRRRTVFKSL